MNDRDRILVNQIVIMKVLLNLVIGLTDYNDLCVCIDQTAEVNPRVTAEINRLWGNREKPAYGGL